MDLNLAIGNYYWKRWETHLPNADVLNLEGQATYHEPVQGGVGNCYIIASAAGVAEFPDLIKKTVLTQTKNDAGIYAFRIYIRGIPWVVSIDSNFLFKGSNELVFAKADKNVMWGPLFEKAWAKVKGSYATSAGGFNETGLSSFVGLNVL